ncbi:hypothetical protein HU200_022191 [Digitaria exilis]|uniref:Uncharacterized protein n=1 Tax=Digitaria exilis TaxID=1010633 RepID=A0A835CDI2_9POAL|nr:hypothetical protein HU200_022191 [Digitaria exilis]
MASRSAAGSVHRRPRPEEGRACQIVRSGGRRSSSAAAVKQLLSRLRSAWRRRAARPRPRRGAARFAYDLQSYRQNFDDGLSSGRPPYRRL